MRRLRRLSVSAPGAGSALVVSASAREFWRLEALTFRYTASAVAGNRYVYAQILDQDGTAVCTSWPATAVSANGHYDFTVYASSAPAVGTSTLAVLAQMMYLPKLWLPPKWSVNIWANGADVGDAITNVGGMIVACDEDAWERLESDLLAEMN